ncbi:hypothetical protein AC579_7629 [Pseudocercospora musae]|uniref:Uncharacterized protein n=1 Tax=Pseudocercospora musae TaxID=113226 RepID=A0A139IC43_9PEZI|nr:hypothetical protein AC579_7629 [Pseudocercospora musae]KXT12318.1 hypothetical protein AC579_7629 [Pseudocercospora musae]
MDLAGGGVATIVEGRRAFERTIGTLRDLKDHVLASEDARKIAEQDKQRLRNTLDTARERITALEKDVKEGEHTIRALEKQVEDGSKQLAKARSTIAKNITELADSSRSNVALEAQKAVLTRERAALENDNIALGIDKADALKTKDDIIQALAEEKSSAEEKARGLQRDKDDISQILAATALEKEALAAKITTSDSRLVIIEKRVARLLRADEHAEVDATEPRYSEDSLEDNVEHLSNLIRDKSDTIAAMRQRMGEANEKDCDEIQRLSQQTESLKERLDDTSMREQGLQCLIKKLQTRRIPGDPRLARLIIAQLEEPEKQWKYRHLDAARNPPTWPSFICLIDKKIDLQDFYPPLVGVDVRRSTTNHYDPARPPDYGQSAQRMCNGKIKMVELQEHDWVVSLADLTAISEQVVRFNHAYRHLSVHGRTSPESFRTHVQDILGDQQQHRVSIDVKPALDIETGGMDRHSSSIGLVTPGSAKSMSISQSRVDMWDDFRMALGDSSSGVASRIQEDSVPDPCLRQKSSKSSITSPSLRAPHERHRRAEPSSVIDSASAIPQRFGKRHYAEIESDTSVKEQTAVHPGKPVCRLCLANSRYCSSYGQCGSCDSRREDCLYTSCPSGKDCDKACCVDLHPGQWKGRERGQWDVVDIHEDWTRKGSASKRPRYN